MKSSFLCVWLILFVALIFSSALSAPSSQQMSPVKVLTNELSGSYTSKTSVMALHTPSEKLSSISNITTIVNINGTAGFGGDGGPATVALTDLPTRISLSYDGEIYFADSLNHVIRHISFNGTIFTVAGKPGRAGYSDGLAVAALLNRPIDVAIDKIGTGIYIADGNNVIRKVDAVGIMTTVAGTGQAGYSGDGWKAKFCRLDQPGGIALLPSGELLIADTGNNVIRKVSSTGVITTIVGGDAWGGYAGDGGLALNAKLDQPMSVAVNSITGDIFIADTLNHAIRKVTSGGIISTIVGGNGPGYSGDRSLAVLAQLYLPYDVALAADGDLYIADTRNSVIRKVGSSGIITTIAGRCCSLDQNGNPIEGFSGDGGPALNAQLHYPSGIAIAATGTATGTVYIADTFNNAVRKVAPAVAAWQGSASPNPSPRPSASPSQQQRPLRLSVRMSEYEKTRQAMLISFSLAFGLCALGVLLALLRRRFGPGPGPWPGLRLGLGVGLRKRFRFLSQRGDGEDGSGAAERDGPGGRNDGHSDGLRQLLPSARVSRARGSRGGRGGAATGDGIGSGDGGEEEEFSGLISDEELREVEYPVLALRELAGAPTRAELGDNVIVGADGIPSHLSVTRGKEGFHHASTYFTLYTSAKMEIDTKKKERAQRNASSAASVASVDPPPRANGPGSGSGSNSSSSSSTDGRVNGSSDSFDSVGPVGGGTRIAAASAGIAPLASNGGGRGGGCGGERQSMWPFNNLFNRDSAAPRQQSQKAPLQLQVQHQHQHQYQQRPMKSSSGLTVSAVHVSRLTDNGEPLDMLGSRDLSKSIDSQNSAETAAPSLTFETLQQHSYNSYISSRNPLGGNCLPGSSLFAADGRGQED